MYHLETEQHSTINAGRLGRRNLQCGEYRLGSMASSARVCQRTKCLDRAYTAAILTCMLEDGALGGCHLLVWCPTSLPPPESIQGIFFTHQITPFVLHTLSHAPQRYNHNKSCAAPAAAVAWKPSGCTSRVELAPLRCRAFQSASREASRKRARTGQADAKTGTAGEWKFVA